jgi:transcriptional repressor NrdR
MRCLYCGHHRTHVVDSRPGRGNDHIRRRRSCPGCGRRFTTFEQPGEKGPLVVKRDGRLEPFNRDKMLAAIRKACTKLPVSESHLDRVVGKIESRIQHPQSRRLRSETLGDWVAASLKDLHPAAYIRYSMVHRHIEDIEALRQFLDEAFTRD